MWVVRLALECSLPFLSSKVKDYERNSIIILNLLARNGVDSKNVPNLVYIILKIQNDVCDSNKLNNYD